MERVGRDALRKAERRCEVNKIIKIDEDLRKEIKIKCLEEDVADKKLSNEIKLKDIAKLEAELAEAKAAIDRKR
jgi:hypothetical protein